MKCDYMTTYFLHVKKTFCQHKIKTYTLEKGVNSTNLNVYYFQVIKNPNLYFGKTKLNLPFFGNVPTLKKKRQKCLQGKKNIRRRQRMYARKVNA